MTNFFQQTRPFVIYPLKIQDEPTQLLLSAWLDWPGTGLMVALYSLHSIYQTLLATFNCIIASGS